MSVLATFYDTVFTILRRSTTTDTAQDTVITAGSGIGLFRPVTDKAQLFVSTNWGKEFDLLCDDSVDIQETDEVVVGTNLYTIAGVSNYKDLQDDSDSHLDIRLFKK